MPFSIKVNGARFNDDKVLASLTLPVLNGLDAEFILGTSLAASRRNLDSGLDELTEISTPTWNSNSVSYSTTTVNTGLQLTTSSSSDNTYILIAEKGWGSGQAVSGGLTGFAGNASDSSCTYASGTFTGSTTRARILNSALPTGFICFIGRGVAGGLGKISAGVAGSLITNTAAAVDGAVTSGPMKLGGDDGINANGVFKVAYFAHFNRALTDDECSSTYLSLRAFFASRGLVVS